MPRKPLHQQFSIGSKISKYFEPHGWFGGEVVFFDEQTKYYHIVYEDGDEEDLDELEVKQWSLEESNNTGRYSRRKRKRVNYANDDDDMLFSDEEDLQKKPRARASKGAKTARKQTKDDEEFSEKSLTESSADEMEFDNEDSLKKVQKAPPDKERVSMADAFKPLNNPLYWTKSLEEIKEEYEYLDPCGREATDDVIDHLVGEQVLKVGKLFQRALEKNETFGSQENPFKLGTVCSGTDAPALALTMVQEQMERFGLSCHLHVQHEFSCEKEPFKQSYLARNFDSILYPDVVKMTDIVTRRVTSMVEQSPSQKSTAWSLGPPARTFPY